MKAYWLAIAVVITISIQVFSQEAGGEDVRISKGGSHSGEGRIEKLGFDQRLQAPPPASEARVVEGFPQLPEGMELGAVSGVEIDGKGNIVVFHRGKNPILVFSPQGKFLRSFGNGLYDSTHFLRFDRDGNIWTTDNKNHTVVKLDPSGKVLQVFGERDVAGEDAGHFDRPADIAFAENGDFFIADGYGNSRVAKFDRSGKFLLSWGKKGAGDGEFNLPHAIRIDSKGRVYVGDRENNRIQVFDQDGKYLRQFGGFAPFGLHIDGNDILYVADGRANKVMRMTLDGKVLEQWGNKGSGPGEFRLPHGITVAADGTVYVSEVGGKRIQRFSQLSGAICPPGLPVVEGASPQQPKADSPVAWQEKAVKYARIMSAVKWTPVAKGMPMRGGYFEQGTEYTGVPYSSVKSVGRYIGFDIFLKTFLAAVQNPHSVLYTENLYGKVKNAECYYGKVCSSYTSYALQCGIWYVSRLHGPNHRKGVVLVEPQSAQSAAVGDVIFTPPASKNGGSHIELVTEVTRDGDGKVTHVRVEESRPQTTSNTNRDAKKFNTHLSSRGRELYRITDLDAWREGNKAESFLFPNYAEDSASPSINRVLLLDRGDWVPYHKGQPVKINIMDRDAQGVKSLVIQQGDRVVEKIDRPGKGVIERSFSTCGDYSAHCVMNDGSLSQACEFSVCDLDLRMPAEGVSKNEPWEVKFSSDNMDIIIVYLKSSSDGYDEHNLFVSDQDRRKGKVMVPANLIQTQGKMQVWLVGENRYGRLTKRQEIVVGE